MRFHHLVGAFSAQPQPHIVVTYAVLLRLVRHGPLVQAEAIERAGFGHDVGQEFSGETDGGLAFRDECLAIQYDAAHPLGRARYPKLGRGGGAVEIFHGVLATLMPAVQERGGESGDALFVCPGRCQPLPTGQGFTHAMLLLPA